MAYEQHIRDSILAAARCVVITLSDTRTEATDTSGRRIRELLAETGHAVVEYRIIPDEADELHHLLTEMLTRGDIDAVLTNGGTGVSRRDRTIEVVQRHLDQELPGFGEIFRSLSFDEIGSGAMMSRAVAGIGRGKVIFAMPGSTPAVELAMSRLILPELKHLLNELRK
ncbi:MAG TPA: MogA/MoaB family molybdenum cofactor biosynthesis protein [Tepidisphaeraceae bacterium]|jgi:molybdenum cofactor biosynthesis protein B|nr:MogA/MoaB family molybdenum cofactor biosynthesis protein [Tepidisphaeraceae bacterium]